MMAKLEENVRDWDKCFLCQNNTTDDLCVPAKSATMTDAKLRKCFEDQVNILLEFHEMNELPENIMINDLLDGSLNILEIMLSHKDELKWHSKCRGNVSNSRLKRARERDKNRNPEPSMYSPVKKKLRKSEVVSECGAQESTDDNVASGSRNDDNDTSSNQLCFICNQVGDKKWVAHRAATFNLNDKVWKCAEITKNEPLKRKFLDGDMIALDAEYHLPCLAKLYRDAAATERGTDGGTKEEREEKEFVFCELLEYLDVFRGTSSRIPMSELVKLYRDRLNLMGIDYSIHTTRLRKSILDAVPDLKEVQHQSGTWDLVYDEDLSTIVKEMRKTSTSDKIALLVKVAKLLREDFLDMKQIFTGSFKPGCERASVPNSLTIFLTMLLDGPSFSADSNSKEIPCSDAALSISQEIVFNAVQRRTKEAKVSRHSKGRTTPFPLYVGIKTYLQAPKAMLDMLYSRGVSVSYKMVKGLSIDIANSVIKFWNEVGLVVPSQTVKGAFTIIGFDNIDWNGKSTLCQPLTTLHGTLIAVHQFVDAFSLENEPLNVDILCPEQCGLKQVKPLPEGYATIDESFKINVGDKLWIPELDEQINPPILPLSSLLTAEYRWLEDAMKLLKEEELSKDDWISWAAYHANTQGSPSAFGTQLRSHVMPLLLQKASDPETVAHVLRIAHGLVNYLNPGQVTMVETDQPLYQVARKLQWKFPNEVFSENRTFISLGALHIEKMLWQMSGDFQDGSGIVTAFSNSGIGIGTACSFLICSNITKTRYHKQILVLALQVLKQRAYQDFLQAHREQPHMDTDLDETEIEVSTSNPVLDMQSWLSKIRTEQPQADYFSLCQEIDLCVLELIRSCRIADLKCYVNSITAVTPFVFALDHLNYARNLPVFLRDLHTLEHRHASLYHELIENGSFMAQKTAHAFSSMPIDQATEQAICWLKQEGAVIGNLDDQQTVRRHQAAVPEMARIVREFEGETNNTVDTSLQHEMYPKFQKDFKASVAALVEAFEKLGNPWKEKSGFLYELDESIVMPDEVVESIRSLKQIGELKFKEFLQLRVNSQEKAFTDSLSRSNMMLFRKALDTKKPTQTVKSVVAERKQQQARVIDILTAHQAGRNIKVLSHESSQYPPSLTKKGLMHHGTKSDIIDCIASPQHKFRSHPHTTCSILDGAALVRKLKPGYSEKIIDYIDQVFGPNVLSHFAHAARVDLVFDRYKSDSIKSATRDERGTGRRRKVELEAKIPGNWQEFLSCDANKKELFALIPQRLLDTTQLPKGKRLIVTINEECKSIPSDMPLESLTPCCHEEADTRMILHLSAAVHDGHTKVLIKANDSDVIVLGVRAYTVLSQLEELWITFGKSQNFSYMAIHEIAHAMGEDRAMAVPAFHAFTGCDSTSSFFGRGKKSAYAAWLSDPSFNTAFLDMAAHQPDKEQVNGFFPILQLFVNSLYGVLSCRTVDEARFELLIHKGKDFDDMPPSSDALYQHTLRATYQSGYIWSCMMEKEFDSDDVRNWGWSQAGLKSAPVPVYTTKPLISRNLREFSICGCTSGKCKGNCKCKKQEPQPCTSLCGCKGKCQ